MEEDAIRRPAMRKGLVGSASRRGQRSSPLGQIENVAVPVKAHKGWFQPAHQRVFIGSGLQLNRMPADFFLRTASDSSTESCGQKLAAQANAEYGLVLF